MAERPKQRDCQNEPTYPDHETVVFSIRSPDMVAHLATGRCEKEYLHLIKECGEYQESEMDPEFHQELENARVKYPTVRHSDEAWRKRTKDLEAENQLLRDKLKLAQEALKPFADVVAIADKLDFPDTDTLNVVRHNACFVMGFVGNLRAAKAALVGL